MRMMAHEPAVEPWPACVLRSIDSVLRPAFAISNAIAEPMTPVPMMMASNVSLMVIVLPAVRQ